MLYLPKGWANFTQRYKLFATASTSTQVAVLPWRYDAEMGTAKIVTRFGVIRRLVEYNKRFGFWFGKY